MKKNKFVVEGIHCSSCVEKIQKALQCLEGSLSISISQEAGEVVVEGEDFLSPMVVKGEIEELGFQVTGFSKWEEA